ncbi:hypothetical protein Klosneuvirus_1_313 [Klosneuvirus KNV1]|uniref:Uncharacterized protein n=1 Tax=Klosneuvirus KNV1 TaxID=1977640 RepID=A0A1V0SIA6_9VIRU|nr:hypothetical protein Klosneuvirus_1_313 [Klosneuvirus KNV1]
MALWNIIDDCEIEQAELNCGCDKCDKELHSDNDKWYHMNVNSWDSHDYCLECGVSTFFDNLVFIDRTNMTIEEKPLKWKCDSCGTRLGGGCKWYTDNKDMDICMNCYNQPKEKLFDFVDKDKCCIIERVGSLVLNNENISNRVIPTQIEKDVTKERMEVYADCINNIAYIDKRFGSYKQWAMFAGPYDLPKHDIVTALLVNCGPIHRGEIASLVSDNHCRVGINIIYDSIDEYLKDYNEWYQMKPTNSDKDNFDYENATLEELAKHEEETEEDRYDDEKIMNACTEFCGYIRLKKNLDTYYG